MAASPLAWGVVAVLALVATGALLVGAFTRFDGGDPPQQGDPGFAAYEAEQYDRARSSTALGLAAAFAFLASAACAQKAARIHQMKRRIDQT